MKPTSTRSSRLAFVFLNLVLSLHCHGASATLSQGRLNSGRATPLSPEKHCAALSPEQCDEQEMCEKRDDGNGNWGCAVQFQFLDDGKITKKYITDQLSLVLQGLRFISEPRFKIMSSFLNEAANVQRYKMWHDYFAPTGLIEEKYPCFKNVYEALGVKFLRVKDAPAAIEASVVGEACHATVIPAMELFSNSVNSLDDSGNAKILNAPISSLPSVILTESMVSKDPNPSASAPTDVPDDMDDKKGFDMVKNVLHEKDLNESREKAEAVGVSNNWCPGSDAYKIILPNNMEKAKDMMPESMWQTVALSCGGQGMVRSKMEAHNAKQHQLIMGMIASERAKSGKDMQNLSPLLFSITGVRLPKFEGVSFLQTAGKHKKALIGLLIACIVTSVIGVILIAVSPVIGGIVAAISSLLWSILLIYFIVYLVTKSKRKVVVNQYGAPPPGYSSFDGHGHGHRPRSPKW